ncbi:winged helix-turn-helix domain-containing protein [Methanothrix soehngenii]|uniref:winged helix-turn-helix domain-containing protein n=1 Tax=Methanothrix soehngenii TaxID=2223 RepID=UPI00300C8AD8
MHAARLRKGGLEALWGNYMRARRSKDQIIVEILNICEKGENLTNIVYRSSISFASIKAYLAVLMKNDRNYSALLAESLRIQTAIKVL